MRSIICLVLLPLSACFEKTPQAQDVSWSLTRADDQKSYTLSVNGRFFGGAGTYVPTIETLDQEGCRRTETLTPDNPEGNAGGLGRFQLDLSRRLASARLTVEFVPDKGSEFPRHAVYAGDQVVAPDVKPPANPVDPCADTPAEKRAKEKAEREARRAWEKAKREARQAERDEHRRNGGYASPALRQYGETIATAINLNGLLCARVVAVEPLQVSSDAFEVTCVEYRGGTGTVRYIVNTADGTAFRP